VDRSLQDILADPQTSGGLLVAVGKEDAGDLVSALKDEGIAPAARIGEVIDHHGELLYLE
jgi:selenide,water dikinase